MCISDHPLHLISIQLAKIFICNVCTISVLASVSVRVWHLAFQQTLTYLLTY